MPRKTTAKPAPKSTTWKPSEWYRKAVAADRAREARQFTTAPKARNPEADAKAVAYAEWLAQRDGLTVPPNGERVVDWQPTEHGYRPRAVAWFPERAPYRPAARGMAQPPRVALLTIELPHWAYEAPEVVTWTEEDETLSLAA